MADISVGFTGTRLGMTREQRDTFEVWVRRHRDSRISEFHHGCCVGADAEAAAIILLLSHNSPYIVGWPSDLEQFVSERACECCDEIHEPQQPLARNRCIVDAVDVLVACPDSISPRVRSGTWATIRYARQQGKKIVFIYPDGNMAEEGGHHA